jgi:hypothetical protein
MRIMRQKPGPLIRETQAAVTHMTGMMLPGLETLQARGFQVVFHGHARAILAVDYPDLLAELESVLANLTIPIESLVRGGGGEHETTQGLRRILAERGWVKHRFEIRKFVDGIERESISHEVDHVRTTQTGKVALEIEWNNKDPFFDRDLENFKRLHAETAISVGIILTRGTSLQDNIRDAVLKFAADAPLVPTTTWQSGLIRPRASAAWSPTA